MSAKDAKKVFEKGLVDKYGARNVGCIPVKGGEAYFRQPTQDEWDTMQEQRENPDGTTNRSAYLRLVTKCYCGAWVDGELYAGELSDIAESEGPAFMAGPAGALVNKLAGTGDRPQRFLGDD